MVELFAYSSLNKQYLKGEQNNIYLISVVNIAILLYRSWTESEITSVLFKEQ